MGTAFFFTVVENIRLGFFFEFLSSTSGETRVFRDANRQLSISLTYVECLTAFTSVSIDKVRLIQLGLLILEPEATTNCTVGFISN